jgi:hypothetical protein
MARLSRRALHCRFLTVLPRIERHARIVFRYIKCWHTKQDKIQEVRSLTWKWIRRLNKLGKKWWHFIAPLGCYACRAVKSGRKVAGMISAKDVLNEITQAKRGFMVQGLPHSTATAFEQMYAKPHGQQHQDAFEERLQDNTMTPVPEQVAFRIDFPAWRKTRTLRDRRLMDDMMAGHRTKNLAQKHRMSEGRISQLRRDFHEDWHRFCAVPDDAA